MRRYYRRTSGVASRVVDGEAFLIKMPENVLFVLNGTASRIWVNADGTRPGQDLTGEWDAEVAQAFLDDMAGRGLLERSSSPCAKADVFPQEVSWPAAGSREPPSIRLSETVEAMGGCPAVDCDPPYSAP